MDVPIAATALASLASGLFGAGVAWGTIRFKVKTMETRLAKLEEDHIAETNSLYGRLDTMQQSFDKYRTETTDRLARMETKLDILVSKRIWDHKQEDH